MPLNYRHISDATTEILDYIDNRRTGTVKSLKTRWEKFNNVCMGGIEPNAIYTIGGISGVGKSTFLNSLETDLIELNPDVDFVILSFNFEMLSSRQVGRKLSKALQKTTQELYSGNSYKSLTDSDMERIQRESIKIKDFPIYYVDIPGSVEEIKQTILEFSELDFVKDKWLIITLDHTLLTKGKATEKERETLATLQYMFMEMKKYNRNTIIQLSQINREIESVERINNPSMHFPTRRDIFGGEAVYQASDYVIVLHRPEVLHLKAYGMGKWPVANMIYMHFIKNREGDLKVLSFYNNLKFNQIEEYDVNLNNTLDLQLLSN
jgi:replicative DNA helicase